MNKIPRVVKDKRESNFIAKRYDLQEFVFKIVTLTSMQGSKKRSIIHTVTAKMNVHLYQSFYKLDISKISTFGSGAFPVATSTLIKRPFLLIANLFDEGANCPFLPDS